MSVLAATEATVDKHKHISILPSVSLQLTINTRSAMSFDAIAMIRLQNQHIVARCKKHRSGRNSWVLQIGGRACPPRQCYRPFHPSCRTRQCECPCCPCPGINRLLLCSPFHHDRPLFGSRGSVVFRFVSRGLATLLSSVCLVKPRERNVQEALNELARCRWKEHDVSGRRRKKSRLDDLLANRGSTERTKWRVCCLSAKQHPLSLLQDGDVPSSNQTGLEFASRPRLERRIKQNKAVLGYLHSMLSLSRYSWYS